METQRTTSTTGESKQITIDVPAERLPEFYAFFARFLARRDVARQYRGRRGHRGRHCGAHRHPGTEEEAQAPAATGQAETASA